jgi:hypothetical protein
VGGRRKNRGASNKIKPGTRQDEKQKMVDEGKQKMMRKKNTKHQ